MWRKLSNEEIAYAMELRSDKITFKTIAKLLNVRSENILRNAIQYAKKIGMKRDR